MNRTKNNLTKLAVVAIVIVAFIDGMLVAQSLQEQDSKTSAEEAVILEDMFQPVETPTFIEEVELITPFISQAPLGDWKAPWAEYAEEAVILMIDMTGEELSSARFLSTELLNLDRWITNHFGFTPSLSAEQTMEVITEHLGKEAFLTEELTESSLKAFLDQGNLIVLPVNGISLENPHYSKPGPEHHILLVTGYTENGFITHDPGTSYGENFVYNTKTLIASIQDLDGGRVGIVIKP